MSRKISAKHAGFAQYPPESANKRNLVVVDGDIRPFTHVMSFEH
jgi:hypothetical protein